MTEGQDGIGDVFKNGTVQECPWRRRATNSEASVVTLIGCLQLTVTQLRNPLCILRAQLRLLHREVSAHHQELLSQTECVLSCHAGPGVPGLLGCGQLVTDVFMGHMNL